MGYSLPPSFRRNFTDSKGVRNTRGKRGEDALLGLRIEPRPGGDLVDCAPAAATAAGHRIEDADRNAGRSRPCRAHDGFGASRMSASLDSSVFALKAATA